MKVRVQYSAHYTYEQPVSFSPHVARVLPQTSVRVRLLAAEFRTNEGADIQYRRDVHSNEIACCAYPLVETATLAFDGDFLLEVLPQNPFHFLLESRATALPVRYTDNEACVLAPFLELNESSAGISLPFWDTPSSGGPTVETLSSLTSAVFRNIAYERRETGDARLPRETLEAGSGACRDTSILLAAVLRNKGLAARLVSGYLWEPDGDPHTHRAEGAMHAWVETYLPGAGWVGLDGTNGVFCDHAFIATAVGLVPEEITPLSGSYYGREWVSSTLHTSVKITSGEET